MDQDRYYDGGPDPGMYGSDRELFKRVWRRVMPEDRQDCPIELNNEEQRSLALPNNQADSVSLSQANMPYENYPAEHSMQCLGEDSAIYGEQMQAFICDEVTDWKLYLALARLADPSGAAVLADIAADKHRHAKRLSAAYFLVSGVRFRPQRMSAPYIDSYPGMLRRRFFSEQQAEAAYLTAADQTRDPCLRELYLELANDNARHSLMIRSILEMLI